MKKLKLWLITLVMILTLTLTGCDLLGPLFGFGENEEKETVQLHDYVTKAQPKTMPAVSEKNMKVNNMRLGDPFWIYDQAMTDEENWLIERDSYVLSYNNDLHIPNWVSWHIEPSHLGDLGRDDIPFKGDQDGLPKEWTKIVTNDYTNSGFDRGHMCPNADRNGNMQMQTDTFYMTNIVPQVNANNGGAWVDLEGYIQDQVKTGKEAYVVAGTWGEGGEGYLSKSNEILPVKNSIDFEKRGKPMSIRIPAYTWKVAILIENDTNDISRINSGRGIEVIGVLMPNSHTEATQRGNEYEEYIVSVNFIEALTGLDFFANIDNSTENALEKKNSGSHAEMLFRTNYDVIEP